MELREQLQAGHAHLLYELVCHCLLIESEPGLILVDTGLGIQDVRDPYPRLSRFYVDLLRVQLKEKETALRQIQRLGFRAEDVRHIVLTHLDFDHAGGLEDFPQATVHVTGAEFDAATHPHGFVARGRYRQPQWDEVRQWQRYRAGDAYFHHREMDRTPQCPPGLAAYQRLMEVDRRARRHNQERLRALALDESADVRLFCAHDAAELAALAAEAARLGQRPNLRAL